jgi:hypothetical protein
MFTFTSREKIAAASVPVSVDATQVVGTLSTRLNTQLTYPGVLARTPGGPGRLGQLAPSLIRVILSNDGSYTASPPTLPAGVVAGSWDFTTVNEMVNSIFAAGAQPVVDIGYMPDWMWNCTTGAVLDPSFSSFGDYAARLVSYYNKGSFVAEDGRTIVNPKGTADRIVYWELWNEPDFWTLSCLPKGVPQINAVQYLAMWNALTVKMRAVDPTIKFVATATATAVSGATPEYLPTVMAGAAIKPDVISFHGYGGWDNTQSDSFLFDGDGGNVGSCCGLAGIVNGVAQVKAWAPGIPIWITEINALSSYSDDPKARNWNAFGAAWNASAFLNLAKAGTAGLFHFAFVNSGGKQFSVVDPDTGRPLLTYWLGYHLPRYFPPGSTILASTSTGSIETLAVRPPEGGHVRVLVVNRQTNGTTTVGGPGIPASVQVNVGGIGAVTQTTLRMLDNATPLDGGPPLVTLGASNSTTIDFTGYGAALLDFSTSGSPTPPAPGTCRSIDGPGIPPPETTPSGIEGFHATWYGQSGYSTLCPGETRRAVVAYYNSGTRGWLAGKMGEVAYLGTWGPDPGQDKTTPLGGDGAAGSPNTGWPRYNRLAVQPAEWVGPNQIAWFQFTIVAPNVPGTYRLAIRPLIEGAEWMEDYGVFWYVTVREP